MPTPIVAGNWKMNTTIEEAVDLASAMLDGLDAVEGVEKVVCPPFVSLAAVAEVLRGSTVALGAQNMYHEAEGAFTGEGLADYAGSCLPVRDPRPLGAPAALRGDRRPRQPEGPGRSEIRSQAHRLRRRASERRGRRAGQSRLSRTRSGPPSAV